MFSKKTRFIGVVVIIAGFALSMFAPVAAATYVPGVKAGDYVKYNVTSGGMTLSAKAQVSGVSGTAVSGTLEVPVFGSVSWTFDVADPKLFPGVLVVAKGLNPGDPFSLGNSVTFASSSDRTYAGGSRRVNYVTFSNETYSAQAYYDKETGVLCEGTTLLDSYTSSQFILTETNLWPNIVLIIGIVTLVSGIAVAAVAGVLLVRGRRRGKT